MCVNRCGRDHVPVDIEFFRRQSERQSDKLRQMQHRHIELLPKVLFDLVLKAVEYGVAERAGRHHCFGPAGLGCEDVLPGELDGDALVVPCGVEAATFSSPAVVDRTTSQDFRKLLDRRVVARIDKSIAARRAGDVAAIETQQR